MSKLRVWLVLTVAGSLALGVVAGLAFLSLFKSQVPAAAISDFTKAASPVTFVGTGLGFGIVIAAWSALVAWLSPRSGTKKPGQSA
jgi:hypothetical protein